ncbi:unnamed protein product, partial [Owenia fusiformis]
ALADDSVCSQKADDWYIRKDDKCFYHCDKNKGYKKCCAPGTCVKYGFIEGLSENPCDHCSGRSPPTEPPLPPPDCSDKAEGWFIKTGHFTFLHCSHGNGYHKYCAEGSCVVKGFRQGLDNPCGHCDTPEPTPPPPPSCDGKDTGLFIKIDSFKYLQCANGIGFEKTCAPGSCVKAGFTEGFGNPCGFCVRSASDQSVCSGKADDYYIKKDDKCFYHCDKEIGFKKCCAPGTCVKPGFKEGLSENPCDHCAQQPSVCTGKADNLYIKKDEKCFYHCDKGVSFEKCCAPGTCVKSGFNEGFDNPCDHCAQPPSVCTGKADNLYIKKDEKCFYHCDKGVSFEKCCAPG